MKLNLLKIGVAVVLFAMAIKSEAQVMFGNSRLAVNGNATTNLVVNYPAFPTFIPTASGITNLVPIYLPSPWTTCAIQVTGQGTNANSSGTVVWTVFKSVSGGSPTNAAGTGLLLDTVGYITNTISGTAPATTVAVYSLDAKAASALQGSDLGIAGVTTLYIGAINAGATTGYTNYTAYVSIK